eukprot:4943319-Prymnesium_polylepis.1
MTAVTTNLIAVPGATTYIEAPQDQSVFVALIFVAGATVGMGGSFFASRVMAPPQMRKSLKEPLLVCRPEGTDSTHLASSYRPIVA